VVTALLTERTARAHVELAADISHANPVLQMLPPAFDAATPAGLAMLNIEVSRQAAMIGYVADFHAMMLITAAAMPLLLLIRRAPREAAAREGAAIDVGH
jgi:DHA2 family multidrug resistance protein